MFKFFENLIIVENFFQFDEDIHKNNLLLYLSHVKFFQNLLKTVCLIQLKNFSRAISNDFKF